MTRSDTALFLVIVAYVAIVWGVRLLVWLVRR